MPCSPLTSISLVRKHLPRTGAANWGQGSSSLDDGVDASLGLYLCIQSRSDGLPELLMAHLTSGLVSKHTLPQLHIDKPHDKPYDELQQAFGDLGRLQPRQD